MAGSHPWDLGFTIKTPVLGNSFFFFLILFYFFFKLYITVLDLPNIKMNPLQVLEILKEG